jgi:ADP-ribose pyrophosphatase YjhB (NUDIX family)
MPKKAELHIVAITAIIIKRGKVLIIKRGEDEVAYPGKWTVPGGKLDFDLFKKIPKTTTDAWYGVAKPALASEVKEETNLKIKDVKYLTDMIFFRPDGHSVLCLSYYCKYAGGKVKLEDGMTEHAWIKPVKSEVKKYDLIEGIPEEILDVGKILAKERRKHRKS